MPAIKITLNRLIELFRMSVSSDLPRPMLELATRVVTLTMHTIRIDQKSDAQAKQITALTEQLATLTDIVQTLAQPENAPAQAPAATTPTEAPSATPVPVEASGEEGDAEEDDEAAFFAKAQREAAAEVAAINANLPPEPAPVAMIPRGKKAGGVK
jgi:hypothetical protein